MRDREGGREERSRVLGVESVEEASRGSVLPWV